MASQPDAGAKKKGYGRKSATAKKTVAPEKKKKK